MNDKLLKVDLNVQTTRIDMTDHHLKAQCKRMQHLSFSTTMVSFSWTSPVHWLWTRTHFRTYDKYHEHRAERILCEILWIKWYISILIIQHHCRIMWKCSQLSDQIQVRIICEFEQRGELDLRRVNRRCRSSSQPIWSRIISHSRRRSWGNLNGIHRPLVKYMKPILALPEAHLSRSRKLELHRTLKTCNLCKELHLETSHV